MGTVAFNSIGFHAALILNRLRNKKRIADDNRADEHCRRENNQKEQTEREQFSKVGK